MNARRLSASLLVRVLVAILLGVVCSLFFPDWLARVFVTFNSLFGNFLGFFIPVLIFALITPAIAGLGRGAGRWLSLTAGLAYLSTILSGFIAYAVARGLYPWLLGNQSVAKVADVEEGALSPYFEVEMPPPFPIMTALLLAFCIGVAMTKVRSDSLLRGARQLEATVLRVISGFVIPLLPMFIFGMFLSLGKNGNLLATVVAFAKVLLLAVVMTCLYLLLQFGLAGLVARVNPLRALRTMLPAYATALGTSSSAATIPVTLHCTVANGVRRDIAGFTVPLCATIHLAGSMMKIMLFAFAIVQMENLHVPVGLAIGFVLMLGITMIAAPGVPGGAIMAAVGLLGTMLGFDEAQVALMIAAYIAIDSFGTAANVTGDGALSLMIDRLAAERLEERPADEEKSAAVE